MDSGTSNNITLSYEITEHHCPCKACAEREMMINSIWEDHSKLLEAAKWFEDSGMAVNIHLQPGVNPLLIILAMYRDRKVN